MTTIDTTSNGNGNGQASTAERARQVWAETGGNITGAEMARRLGVPERTGSYHVSRLRKQTGNPPAPTAATPQPTGNRRPATPRNRQAATQDVPVLLTVGTRAAVAVVAVVAGLLSYSHIRNLAIAAGSGWEADILPLSLDGLVAACTFTLVHDRRTGRGGNPLAWAGIVVGLIGSVAANVIAVDPSIVDLRVVAQVLAAFPPLALAVSAHLLVQTSKGHR